MNKREKAVARSKMIWKEFIVKSHYYSFSYAVYSTAWWIGWYVSPLRKLCMWGFRHKDKYVKHYLYSRYGDIIKTHRENKQQGIPLPTGEYPIWVFWYQGFSSAPPLVQACLENLKRKNSNVREIDKDNYSKFIEIPQYILDKVQSGVISLTHFSDIIRIGLLAQWGGIWIDATCYCSETIPKDVKLRRFYSSKTINCNPLPLWSNSRWCGWGQGSCCKHYPLYVFIRDMLWKYWQTEDFLIDYLLLDALIGMGFEENPKIREDIKVLPENNRQRNALWLSMNNPYSLEMYEKLTRDTWLFKLSYKTTLLEYTANGKPTFYHQLLTNQL